jgi:DNA-directed RNA polymerase subunit RPC12/RpoP
MKVILAKYKCEKCGSEDTDKLFEHEKAMPKVNCWNCKGDGSMKLTALTPRS